MQNLVLVDGHHLMYRAFYAIPKTLKMKNGELTNVTYGVASMLLALFKAEQPDALLFCFDEGEETFRHKENATYKEGRAETPNEFYVQIPRVIELLHALGIVHESNPGFEADDLLCSYATLGEKEGMKVTIVTGDRDTFQLATPNVRIAIPHKGYQQPEYLGPAEIFAKYGIRPDQVASYKGLSGDASDNLPGVTGIGPKTAAQLLQSYGTLEGIYAHLADIKPSTRQKLEHDKDQAFFCERMARLVCPPPQHSLDDIRLKDIPLGRARDFLRSLAFQSLAARLETIARSPWGQGRFADVAVPVPAPAEASQLSLF
jgi:DNA polymerase I